MKQTINYTGYQYITNENYEITILEYFSNTDITIKFNDSNLILTGKHLNNIKSGNIKNPYHKSIYGKYFIGHGKYNSTDISYKIWLGIFDRINLNESGFTRQKSYINCSIDESWHNFQNFAEWFHNNYVPGFHLDKDLLSKEFKMYGPTTCCFLPLDINNFFRKRRESKTDSNLPTNISMRGNKFKVQVYTENGRVIKQYNTLQKAIEYVETERKNYIIYLANKYKNQLKENVFNALINIENAMI